MTGSDGGVAHCMQGREMYRKMNGIVNREQNEECRIVVRLSGNVHDSG